jgi:hypothetical protein
MKIQISGMLTSRIMVFSFVTVILLIFFISCNLDSPNSPALNNPMDPDNPFPPRTPTDLKATAISSTEIQLTWTDNSGNEEGTEIEISVSNNQDYILVGTAQIDDTTFTITGLMANLSYFSHIRAANRFGESLYSNEVQVITPNSTPAEPTDLRVTTTTSSSIGLVWIDNSHNETGFKLERSDSADWQEIITISADDTIAQDTGLTPATLYKYRLKTINDVGSSNSTNEVEVTTLDVIPSAPSELTAIAVNSSHVDLNWIDNSENEDGFVVQRRNESGVEWDELATLEPNITSYSDEELEADTGYYYRISAYNEIGFSEYSEDAMASTGHAPPAAPSGLEAHAISRDQIDLAWRDNSNSEEGFIIDVSPNDTMHWNAISLHNANQIYYQLTEIGSDTLHFFRVRAYNQYGISPNSDIVSATIPQSAPVAPWNLFATPISSSSAQLEWSDNSNNENGFIVEIMDDSTDQWIEKTRVPYNTDVAIDTALTPLVRYYYRVKAYNFIGESEPSNIANVTPVLFAPSGLSANTESSSSISLNWIDNSIDESGFIIERRTTANPDWAEISRILENITVYSDEGLIPLTEYYYRVKAYNDAGYSDPSNVASSTPTLEAPSGLEAISSSSTSISLNWLDNTSDESGFIIERRTLENPEWSELARAIDNITSHEDLELTPSVTYHYRVKAFNPIATSIPSNVSSAMPVLAAPSGLGARATSSTEITLHWLDNSDDEIGFKIERQTLSDPDWTEIVQVSEDITSFADQELTHSMTYNYRVKAYNSIATSGPSNVASATPILAAPSGLEAMATSSSSIELNWLDNSIDEVGFVIEKRTLGIPAWNQVEQLQEDVTTFEETGLTPSITYYYRVRAYNNTGNSEPSNVADATPVLAAPSGLRAEAVSSTEIELNWLDNSEDETGFRIDRRTFENQEWVELVSLDENITSVSDAGLTPNMTYFYQVAAFNEDGDSEPSAEVSETTSEVTLIAPSDLNSEAVSMTMIRLNWNDNAENEVGFSIERNINEEGWEDAGHTFRNQTEFVDSDLSYSNSYQYRVYAFNEMNSSEPSEAVDATTGGIVAFVAEPNDGIRILDVSIPDEISRLGRIVLDRRTNCMVCVDNLVYLSGGYIIDIADPIDTELLGPEGWSFTNMEVIGDYLYGVGSITFAVLDISNPDDPQQISSLADMGAGSLNDIQIHDDHAFISASALLSINISDPENPERIARGVCSGGWEGETIHIVDDYAIIGSDDHIFVFDISNPAELDSLTGIETDFHSMDFYVVGDLCYVAALGDGLKVLDISDPENIEVIGEYQTWVDAIRVVVLGDFAYVAASEDGLNIIDVSDPTNPRYAGQYDLHDARVVLVKEYR